MAFKDYLRQNGFGALKPAPLTFKLTADTNVLFPYAKVVDGEDGKPAIEFTEEADSSTVAVTKDYAFVSYARTWNDTDQKYDYTGAEIHQIETSEVTTGVSITETLTLVDAAELGEDTTGQTGPTMSVTRTVTDWPVVSCVKEVQKGEEIVYNGLEPVTVKLF